ncbi:MAG: IPTL-CTERM sorting domain-containing protein [Methylacidiphilales bacterium]|nr:IPTL-CTERM sorting domain-containing protein [Candidatus Methylacidiphilales bacterium]
MLPKKLPCRVRLSLAALLWAASLPTAQASAGKPALFPNSIREVSTWTQTGPPDPHRPWITRNTLTQDEKAASLDFEVALKMRNFSELQARVAGGERISPQEMEARYDPLPSDSQAVADWLTSQGFVITRQSPDHLAVFARGTVSQIQQAMQVQFARVSLEGTGYTSAVTVPSLPANLSGTVLGINGLQPYIRFHKHVIARPASLTGANPPFTPSQIAHAYDANGLYSSNITGAGQAIAIVIDTFPLKSDLTSFWQTYGINQSINNITFIQVISGTLPATSGEETLDTEWSSSIAPGAKVRVYAAVSLASANLDQAYEQVYIDATTQPQLGIHQMSMSYGEGETYTSQSQVDTDDQYFVKLASAGVTVFASAGDGGSTPGSGSAGDETGPLQVESPASDPYVTGVGGTSLTLNTSGNESSETVWNNLGQSTNYGATGGGTSEYFYRPSWQTGTGVPSGTMRTVPDVACPADPNTGAYVTYQGAQDEFGGTSWSSPTWAGFCALMNQARISAGLPSLGLLGPQIYPLIGSANFRDITSGNNATSKSGGLYSAGVGYDQCTGIGVPLVQTLNQTLIETTAQPQAQIQPLFQNVVPGQNATITVTASGSPIGYQWQRMPVGSTTWSNLSNNGTYTGSATASLTVHGSTTAMSGDQFQCVVTYSGPTTATSASSALVVDTPYTIIHIAGQAGVAGSPTSSDFNYPSGIAIDSFGNLFIADYSNNCIREVTPAGSVSTPYGSTSGRAGSTNANGNSARFRGPNAIVADSSNNLYVADTGNNSIRKIAASGGAVSTLPVTGFNAPNGIAIDGLGNLYVADSGNNVIKKITSAGSVSVLAGTSGSAGYVNANGASAKFNNPASVAVDSLGNVYVADLNNDVVRKITSSGAVTLFAGQPGSTGYADGLSLKALFDAPCGVAVDSSNNVYVTDSLIPPIGSIASGNNLLRRISSAGVVSTIAGQPGVTGSANGTGTAAQFYSLQSATFNSAGEVFLTDTYNQLIRAGGVIPAVVTPPLGQVITIGQPVAFSVTPSGTSPLTYQWLKNSSAISGATSSTFSIGSIASTDAGNYAVTVTNSFGNVTSTTATLVPVNSQPVAQSVTAGQPATFSISVAGPGPLTYQWLFNGSAISGATGSAYTIPNASSGNAGNYSVMVTDANGSATTSPVALTVVAATSDTPTMPPWALALLATLLILVATNVKRRKLAPLSYSILKIRVSTLLLAVACFVPFPFAQAQDIDLTGYTQSFDEEFNSLSLTSTSPKGASTWYYWPPYGSAGAYSNSIWDTNAFSVSGGILSDKAWILTGQDTAGAYSGGPVSMKDGSGTAIVTGVTTGTTTNSHSGFQWDGYVGMKFTTGASGLTVSQLGRYVVSGNSKTHDLKLVDAATGTDVPNSVTTVNTSGATAGTFVYASLPVNVTLQANHSYYLLSHEGNGGSSDSWYNGTNTTVTTTSAITVNASEWGSWHSGNLSSMDPTGAGFGQQYGYFEMRCQIPSSGTGAWPAFWLESQNAILNNLHGTSLPNEEIDIFEWYGGAYTNNSSVIQEASHNWTPSGGPAGLYSPATPMPGGAFPWQGYHIYGCQVDPANITWYIDGVQTNQIATPAAYVTSPFYIMVDYAIGGGWPSTGMVNPSSLNVDWVRVYSLPTWPVISSSTTATGTEGSAFSYQISALNSPISYNATGLPSGLTVNTGTGMISGTPTSSGTYPVTLSATNSNGTGTATLTLVISSGRGIGIQFRGNGTALASTDSAGLTSVAQTHWNALTGASFTNQALSDNTGTSASATLTGTAGAIYGGGGSSAPPAGNAKLASGELVNGSTAGGHAMTVSNIPYGFYDVYVYAAIDATGRNETVSLTPSGGAAQYSSFTTEGGGSTWTAATSTWNGTGTAPSLPSANYVHFSGLTASSFSTTFWAPGNGGMNAIQIVPDPPVITSPATATGTEETAFNYQIIATTNPTSYNATGLPTGLSINTTTGVISGSPTVSGAFPIMITASSTTGTTTITLTLTLATSTDTPTMPQWALLLLAALLFLVAARRKQFAS